MEGGKKKNTKYSKLQIELSWQRLPKLQQLIIYWKDAIIRNLSGSTGVELGYLKK